MTATSEKKTPEEATKTATRKMTPSQWTEAKALWETGEFTLGQISKKVGFSKEHLSRRFKKEGIEKGAKSAVVEEAVAEEVESEAIKSARINQMRGRETKDEHYTWTRSIARVMMQQIGKTISDGRTISHISEDLKGFDRAMSVLAKAYDQRARITGIEKEDFLDDETLPSLVVENMSDEQLENVRAAAREQSLGVGDGLGGVLDTSESVEDENALDEYEDVVEEDFEELDDSDLEVLGDLESDGGD